VPAGLAAAAHTLYRERLEAARFPYYGRVVREGGYLCLQYWFFYAMNDWRSTFHGINDHEADWELAVVYLAERSGERPQPAWVAFSSHDYRGDDLRRRWDDPGLTREGDHAVLFAGAGSHSGAFVPGDYVVRVDPPALRAALGFLRGMLQLSRRRHSAERETGFGIPFVDYARGDGVGIGPGHDASWSPVPIDEETPWVRDYTGLWGLDTQDRFGGERAPAGPRYDRDGSVRTAWASPAGWAGLLKIPPRIDEVAALLAERVTSLESELAELDASIEAELRTVRRLRAGARSLDGYAPARTLAQARWADVAKQEAALQERIARRTRLSEERRAHLSTLNQPLAPEPPHAHIRRPHAPLGEAPDERQRVLKLWSRISIPLLLGCIVVALTAPPLATVTTIALIAAVFPAVEAVARGRFVSLLINVSLLVGALALSALLTLLLLSHWRLAVSVLIAIAAVALLIGNMLRG
jgi:hypothetical protein